MASRRTNNQHTSDHMDFSPQLTKGLIQKVRKNFGTSITCFLGIILLFFATLSFYNNAAFGGRDVTGASASYRTSSCDTFEFRCANTKISRLDQYCAAKTPIEQHEQQYFQQHGATTNSSSTSTDGWTLRHLVLNIRHGDRSSIHTIPGTTSSGKKEAYVEPEALAFRNRLSKFRLQFLEGSGNKDKGKQPRRRLEQPAGESLMFGLDPALVFKVPDSHLDPGQLTTRGVYWELGIV
jgi:hypothetical protein